jgi:DNA-directed RNA polymerase I, II, and III subunit RPABC2
MADNDDVFAGAAAGDEFEVVEEDAMAAEADTAGAAAVSEDPYEMLYKFHPETVLDYAETIAAKIPLQAVPAGPSGKDEAHKSPPFLTVYERTKILGTRANQLAEGARPFVTVPEHMTQPLEIAKLELEQRRLPFIIKRPMPDGTFEYWRLSDLMIL